MSLFKPRGKHASGAGIAPEKQEEGASNGTVSNEGVDVADEVADGSPFDSTGSASDAGGQVAGAAVESAAASGSASSADDAPSGEDGKTEAVSGIGGVADGSVDGDAPVVSATDAAGFVSAGFGEIPSRRRHLGLKIFGVTFGIVIAAALVAYVAGGIVFAGRFLPNTEIGDRDVSLKTDEEVVSILEDIASGYRLDVVGSGFSYRATGKELGLSIDAEGIVDAMHADLDSWRWPLLILQPVHDETDQLSVSCKPSSYKKSVTAAVEKFNEAGKDPVNAAIFYDKKSDQFKVQPEEAGTKLDVDAVLVSVKGAIDALETKVSLGDEQLIQPTVLATDEKLIEAAELATGMVSADLTLVMDGKDSGTINGDMLSGFISVNDDYEVVFKEEEMNAWVDSLVEGFNTIGTERTYTRADGKAIAVSGGVYGWEIDIEALRNAVVEGIKAGAKADIEIPCTETAEVFNGANQRDWGNRYLDVDISEQHVRFYGDDGAVIWETDFISGAPDGKHDTVEGVWYVNAKESPSKLIGYENGKKIYETSVKFWMPFEGNSIGFHDATWQPSFGGSMYANGYGSHGCVNLSYNDAEELYGIIEEGDVVVVHK